MNFLIFLVFISNFLILTLQIIAIDQNNPLDTDFNCQKFDFETKFNISVGSNITVVYNSSLCKKCLQKLLLFKALQNRFENASYNELNFVMLTTEHSGTQQFEELKHRAGNILLLSLHDISNEFFIPKSFYIFDRCSRLTYELTPPFNEVQYQVVKAAILSTWFDTPCGNCNTDQNDNYPYYTDENDNDIDLDEIEEYQTTPSASIAANMLNQSSQFLKNFDLKNLEYQNAQELSQENPKEDESYVIPLRIIIPSEHIHENDEHTPQLLNVNEISKPISHIKYNFFVLNSNDSSFHEHLENDQTEILYQNDVIPSDDNSTVTAMKLISEDGTSFEIIKNYTIVNQNQEKPNSFYEIQQFKKSKVILPKSDESSSEKNFRNTKNSSVYEALHPWLSFRLVQKK